MEADGSIGIMMEKKKDGSLTSPNLAYAFSQKEPLLFELILKSTKLFVK